MLLDPCLAVSSPKAQHGDGCFYSSKHRCDSYLSPIKKLTLTEILSIPFGIVSGALLLLTVPRDFPYQGRLEQRKRASFGTVDFVGALLMLSALAIVITGLERAASLLSWTTADALGPLCAGVVAWAAFLASQYRHDSRPQSLIEPVFPWRFCRSRVVMGLILCVMHPWNLF